MGKRAGFFASVAAVAGVAVVCGCAVCEKTVRPGTVPADPLVFTGDVREGALIAAPEGDEQTFECWFMALGAGQGDKPYDRIVQTPDWYLHTIASADEVSSLTFGYTGADGKVQGFGNLGAVEGIYFGKWQRVAVTYAPEGFRVYLNGRRSQGRRREVPLETLEGECGPSRAAGAATGESPEKISEAAELREKLSSALNALPPELRACVVLVDVEGHDYGRAAEILGWPVGSVSGRLFRARRLLREMLRRVEGI